MLRITKQMIDEFDAEIVDDWPEPARLPLLPQVRKQVRQKPTPTFTNRSMF
jgi:hypothetical protein